MGVLLTALPRCSSSLGLGGPTTQVRVTACFFISIVLSALVVHTCFYHLVWPSGPHTWPRASSPQAQAKTWPSARSDQAQSKIYPDQACPPPAQSSSRIKSAVTGLPVFFTDLSALPRIDSRASTSSRTVLPVFSIGPCALPWSRCRPSKKPATMQAVPSLQSAMAKQEPVAPSAANLQTVLG